MQKRVDSILLVLALALLHPSVSQALTDSKSIGLILVVKGEVTLTNTLGEAEKAKVGLEVYEGDRVKAGTQSVAKIMTIDRNVLVVGENSDVEIKKYRAHDQTRKQVEIQLNQGSVRSSLSQTYTGPEEHYQVETPSAISGVRGTDFLIEYNAKSKQNVVCTFKGMVAYQNLESGRPKGPESAVAAGNFIRQNFGEAPRVSAAKPEWVQGRLAAHEIRPNENFNVKPVPRAQPGGPQGGPQGTPQQRGGEQNKSDRHNERSGEGSGGREGGQGPGQGQRGPGQGAEGQNSNPQRQQNSNGPGRGSGGGPSNGSNSGQNRGQNNGPGDSSRGNGGGPGNGSSQGGRGNGTMSNAPGGNQIKPQTGSPSRSMGAPSPTAPNQPK